MSVPSSDMNQSEIKLIDIKTSEVKPSANLAMPSMPVYGSRNWLIHLYYVRRDYDNCKDKIKDELIETDGFSEYALYTNGLLLRLEGKIQDSIESFRQCSILNPDNVANYKQIARSLILLARHKAALEVYTEAEKKASKDWEIYHNKGICYMYLKDLDMAKESFKTALRLNLNDLSYILLARTLISAHNFEMALKILEDAKRIFTENTEILFTLGLLYIKLDNYASAQLNLSQALQYDPLNSKILMAAGYLYQSRDVLDMAIEQYKGALQTIPECSALWNNIGMCLFRKKKYIAAISCLKRANYLSPFDWIVLYNLGLVHCVTQQFASAFRFLSSAINMKAPSPRLYMLFAVSLTRLNDNDNAQRFYKQATAINDTDLKMDKGDALVPLNYAIFLYHQNQKSASREQLALFMKISKEIPQSNNELNLMQETFEKLTILLNTSDSLSNKPSTSAETPDDQDNEPSVESESETAAI